MSINMIFSKRNIQQKLKEILTQIYRDFMFKGNKCVCVDTTVTVCVT